MFPSIARFGFVLFSIGYVFLSSASASLRIMPLGDSITYGMGAGPQEIPGGYRDPLASDLITAGVNFTFVGSVTGNSTSALTSTGQQHNEGHTGYRIDQIQASINNWQISTTPDVVLLHLGTNDILHGYNLGSGVDYDTSAAIARLSNLITTLYANNSSLTIVLSNVIPIQDGRDNYVKNYNALLASTVVPNFVSLGRSISLVDNYANFVTGTGAWRTELYADYAHPNAAGYKKMADTYAAVASLIPEPPRPPNPHPTLQVDTLATAGAASQDGKIKLNLIRAGQPTLGGVTVSQGSSLPAQFKTAGLNDGSAAANANLTYYSINQSTAPTSFLPTTITFNLAGSATGYDLTGVQLIAGWGDSNIGDIKFQLLLSINGGAFTDYGTYSNNSTINGGNFATLTTVTDTTGLIASGVTGIRIVALIPDGSQGGAGGTVVREIQAFGTATVPEPSIVGLLGIALGSLAIIGCRRRRF